MNTTSLAKNFFAAFDRAACTIWDEKDIRFATLEAATNLGVQNCLFDYEDPYKVALNMLRNEELIAEQFEDLEGDYDVLVSFLEAAIALTGRL